MVVDCYPARATGAAVARPTTARAAKVRGRMVRLLSRGARGGRVAVGCCQQPVLVTVPSGQVVLDQVKTSAGPNPRGGNFAPVRSAFVRFKL